MPSEFDTVSTTVTKPSPVLEGSLSAFVPYLNKLMKGAVPSTFAGIDTSVYDPKVAAQDALQKQAAQAASGLTSLVGPDAYKPYMSPYQQEVMDTTMAEFDRQAAIDSQGLRDAAISRGAY